MRSSSRSRATAWPAPNWSHGSRDWGWSSPGSGTRTRASTARDTRTVSPARRFRRPRGSCSSRTHSTPSRAPAPTARRSRSSTPARSCAKARARQFDPVCVDALLELLEHQLEPRESSAATSGTRAPALEDRGRLSRRERGERPVQHAPQSELASSEAGSVVADELEYRLGQTRGVFEVWESARPPGGSSCGCRRSPRGRPGRAPGDRVVALAPDDQGRQHLQQIEPVRRADALPPASITARSVCRNASRASAFSSGRSALATACR